MNHSNAAANSHSHSSKHAIFSFFSGAGFLDLGFETSGFEVVFANEINKEFVSGAAQIFSVKFFNAFS